MDMIEKCGCTENGMEVAPVKELSVLERRENVMIEKYLLVAVDEQAFGRKKQPSSFQRT